MPGCELFHKQIFREQLQALSERGFIGLFVSCLNPDADRKFISQVSGVATPIEATEPAK